MTNSPKESEKKDETAHVSEPKEENLEKQIEELTDMLQRNRAEFLNYKQRVEKEQGRLTDDAKAELVKNILPVIDSFELALKNTKDTKKFTEGVEMVFAQLMELLKQQGLKQIRAEGDLDPYKHEVLLKVPSDEEEDTILEVLQKGYIFKDRVIRHAKVKVSK